VLLTILCCLPYSTVLYLLCTPAGVQVRVVAYTAKLKDCCHGHEQDAEEGQEHPAPRCAPPASAPLAASCQTSDSRFQGAGSRSPLRTSSGETSGEAILPAYALSFLLPPRLSCSLMCSETCTVRLDVTGMLDRTSPCGGPRAHLGVFATYMSAFPYLYDPCGGPRAQLGVFATRDIAEGEPSPGLSPGPCGLARSPPRGRRASPSPASRRPTPSWLPSSCARARQGQRLRPGRPTSCPACPTHPCTPCNLTGSLCPRAAARAPSSEGSEEPPLPPPSLLPSLFPSLPSPPPSPLLLLSSPNSPSILCMPLVCQPPLLRLLPRVPPASCQGGFPLVYRPELGPWHTAPRPPPGRTRSQTSVLACPSLPGPCRCCTSSASSTWTTSGALAHRPNTGPWHPAAHAAPGRPPLTCTTALTRPPGTPPAFSPFEVRRAGAVPPALHRPGLQPQPGHGGGARDPRGAPVGPRDGAVAPLHDPAGFSCSAG